MFKKTAFACAVLALASAQNLQSLLNQATEAVAPVLNQASSALDSTNNLSLDVNNYEWVLNEQGEFSITEAAVNSNNLAPTLAALLTNVGTVAQDNSAAIGDIINAEAASLGVSVEGVDTASVTNQIGGQLTENADAISSAANNNYQQGASALAQSSSLQSQANQQLSQTIQNSDSLSAAVSSGVNTAVNNAEALNVNALPAVNGNDLAPLANEAVNAASNAAGTTDVNQAASNLQNLASQALASGAAQTNAAALDAANTASATVDAVTNALNANGVNNVNDAANLVNAGNQ